MRIIILLISFIIISEHVKSQVLIGATESQIKELVQAKGLFKLAKTSSEQSEYGKFTKLNFIPKDGTKGVRRTYTISFETGLCTIYTTTQPIKVMQAFYSGLMQSGYKVTKGGGWISPDREIFLSVQKDKYSFTATFIKNIFDD